ncbi:MAG: S8 family serine peptidase, partial [Aquihabitans sp.]
MSRTHRGRVAGWALIATLLLGSGAATGGAPASGAPSQATPKANPLSARLQDLADAPGASATTQADVAGLPADGDGRLNRAGDGRLYVDVWGTTHAAVAGAANVPGASLEATGPDGLTATIAIPANGLDALGAVPGLRSAREVIAPDVARSTGAAGVGRTSAAPQCPTGIPDGGNEQLKAALARTAYGVDGAGVPVGVISDSFGSKKAELAGAIASGDLPGPTNPCGYPTPVKVLFDDTGTDEGRAMVEIVHDLAPDAPLLFADSGVSQIDMANHIRALRDAGARVIVDDISYPQETFYQDGPIAAAVDEVTAQGVTYFSAAGNETDYPGDAQSGPSIGSYESAAFRPAPCPAGIPSGYDACHDFDPGAGVTASDRLTMTAGNGIFVTAAWNEPAFGVTTNLDFFVLAGSSAKVLSNATDDNIVGGQPTEAFTLDSLSSNSNTDIRLVVARRSGSTGTPRFKWLLENPTLWAAQWTQSTGGDVVGPTIYGHSKTLVSAGVAATPVSDSSLIESFSSLGPVTYCWAPVAGTTPSPALDPCQDATVDFAATDGVTTSVTALNPFFGTSAAAPHAAAVAALMLQHEPCRSPAEVLAALRAGAKPIAGYGIDAQGAGLVDAVDAIAALPSCGNVPAPPGAPQVTAAGPGSATLSWTAPTSTGGTAVTGYQIQVLDQDNNIIATKDQGTSTSDNIAALPAGAYRFRVRAKAAVESAWSPASALAIPPFATTDAFIRRQYDDFNDVAPAASQLQAWNEQLIAGTSTPADLIVQATNFAVWRPKLDGVTRLY